MTFGVGAVKRSLSQFHFTQNPVKNKDKPAFIAPECEIGVNIVVESHGGISGGADQCNTYAANYVEGKYHLDKDQMKTAIMNK